MPEYFWYVCKVSSGEDGQFSRVDGPGIKNGTRRDLLEFIWAKLAFARSGLRREPRADVLAICTRNGEAAFRFVSTNLTGSGLTAWERRHWRADQRFEFAFEEYCRDARDVSEESSSDEEEPEEPSTEEVVTDPRYQIQGGEVADWSEDP